MRGSPCSHPGRGRKELLWNILRVREPEVREDGHDILWADGHDQAGAPGKPRGARLAERGEAGASGLVRGDASGGAAGVARAGGCEAPDAALQQALHTVLRAYGRAAVRAEEAQVVEDDLPVRLDGR